MPTDDLLQEERRDLFRDAFPPVPTEAWRRKIVEDLKGADYAERLVWHPPEGFDVQPFYRAEDLAALPTARPPGKDAGNDWLIRQDLAADDAAEANRLAHEALAGGAASLGFDVSVRRQPDLARLLDGLPLATTPLHFAAGDASRTLLAMLLNEAARRRVPPADLRGSLAWDPLGRLARRGRLPAEAALDETARLLEDAGASGAPLHTLRIDAQSYHEAGGSAVHELAFALAAASDYFAGLTDRGFGVDQLARRTRFVVAVGTSFFMEIAKMRALRLLFAHLVHAFDGEHPARAFVEAVTSRWSLTRYDPHGNLLRATTEAAAAVLGGCDELTVRPFDEAAGGPGDFSLRLARNVQLILKHEAHLDAVADPGAGAYYLENLTDRLARHAWTLFRQVEARGGLLEALRQGFVQEQIRTVREAREQEIAAGRRVFVGVNRFPDPDETRLDDPPADAAPPDDGFPAPLPLARLRERLAEGSSLDDLAEALDPGDFLSVEALPARRGAAPFEALRLRTERHARAAGRRPAVLLLPFGDAAMANSRATFARNFFGCAGFAIEEAELFEALDAAARAVQERRAEVVVLCSADADYAALAPAVCAALRAAEPRPTVVVAGYPKDQVEALEDAGVDAFIHRKSNLLETLSAFQQRLGIAEA